MAEKPSSTVPSQSLSSPSQASVPAGLMAESVSSQSVLSLTYPLGTEQAVVVLVLSP